MRQPRSAKANPFPYRGSLVCYLSLDAAGSLTQVGHDFSSAAEAYRRAAAGEIRLYAVWPGEYSSDLFEIDDLNAFADAFGVERPDPHVHDLAWTLSLMDDGTSRYANVNVVFRCGCTLSKQNIKSSPTTCAARWVGMWRLPRYRDAMAAPTGRRSTPFAWSAERWATPPPESLSSTGSNENPRASVCPAKEEPP